MTFMIFEVIEIESMPDDVGEFGLKAAPQGTTRPRPSDAAKKRYRIRTSITTVVSASSISISHQTKNPVFEYYGEYRHKLKSVLTSSTLTLIVLWHQSLPHPVPAAITSTCPV
jgi:hypothetical protein